MQFKTFLIAAISATAMAQDSSPASDLASLASDFATLSFDLPNSALSVLSVLTTAIPSTLLTALSDPAFRSSFASQIDAGSTPAWYSDLPSDVQSYLNNAASATSNMPLSSVASSLTAAQSSIRSSVSSRLESATASATAGSTSTSTAGAPAPTGAIVASMAGVVGVLALAIGL